MNKPDALVFFDLDGTLLTSNVEVANSSIFAMKELKQKNIQPFIATGRCLYELKHIMQLAGIDSVVSLNGQSVCSRGQNIYSNNINMSTIEALYEFAKTKHIPVSFYNDHIMRISKHDNHAKQLYSYMKQPIPPVDDEIFKHENIQMMLLLCETGESHFIEAFPQLTFIRNTPYCVDVFNKGGSKANGIAKLVEAMSLEDVPTYAFGDGLNDLEMFAYVDHPIAMSNAHHELKALAEYITDDNDHDGIVNGLRWAGLI